MDTVIILNILYIVLIIFFLVIGILLAIILIKVIKILGPISKMVGPVEDLAGIYWKTKAIVSNYGNIPNMIINSFFKRKKRK